ncbi:MAG: type III-B CRISPR module RAMP protein Cmr1 [Candidatus Methanodesulfokora sp.]|jgi:CRISPR-associated protein Cmr1
MILRLELEGETPLFLGGYDTNFHPDDPFRTQSLKGLWRYWLRAYIAGAMHEIGLLKCEEGRYTVCDIRDRELLKKLGEKTEDILGGLGSASKFRIVVKKAWFETRYDRNVEQRIQQAPRVKLLALKKEKFSRQYHITPPSRRVTYGIGLHAEIEVKKAPHVRHLDENEIKLAFGSLLTALSLNGLGKMGRRGFGTFSIKIDGPGIFSRFLKEKMLDFGMIGELISETLNAARSYIREEGRGSGIPPMDCISRVRVDLSDVQGSSKLFDKREMPVFTVIKAEKRGNRALDYVLDLQNFFYRPERGKRIWGFEKTDADRSRDPLVRNRLSWFLGLPRSQKNTGYMNAERRAGPIHLAVHEAGAFFTFFLSGDWPKELRWRGYREKQLKIGLQEIKNAYLTSVSLLEDYLSRIGYSYEVVFP